MGMVTDPDEPLSPLGGQPKGWRIALAFFIAPLVPAAVASIATIFDGLPNGSYPKTVALFALFGAYPAPIIFGVPAFLFLRRRLKPRFVYVVLAGGFVAAAPWLLLVLLGPNPDTASIGTHLTVQAGHKTLWGWIEDLRMVGGVFLLGLIGGVAFWLVAVCRFHTDARGLGSYEPPTG